MEEFCGSANVLVEDLYPLGLTGSLLVLLKVVDVLGMKTGLHQNKRKGCGTEKSPAGPKKDLQTHWSSKTMLAQFVEKLL
jgi:hypothetical protein